MACNSNNNKKTECWQRSNLGISWKIKVTNEEDRVRTGQPVWMISSVKEDSTGLDMWYEWITSAHLDRRCTGRFQGLREAQVVRIQTGLRSTVNKDLLRMGITWEETEVAAQNRSEWCQSVAQCIYLDMGWVRRFTNLNIIIIIIIIIIIKVKAKVIY